jgi:ATP-binding cassette subfamily F protein uup
MILAGELPAGERIAALEAEQKSIQAALADGSLYASDNARAVQLHQRDGEIDDQLMEALERWSALSE